MQPRSCTIYRQGDIRSKISSLSSLWPKRENKKQVVFELFPDNIRKDLSIASTQYRCMQMVRSRRRNTKEMPMANENPSGLVPWATAKKMKQGDMSVASSKNMFFQNSLESKRTYIIRGDFNGGFPREILATQARVSTLNTIGYPPGMPRGGPIPQFTHFFQFQQFEFVVIGRVCLPFSSGCADRQDCRLWFPVSASKNLL